MPFPNPDTQFKPGNPGGPGRPRRGIITDAAADLLEQPHPKHPDKTRKQVIAERWLDRAEEDDESLEMLQDRVEGKVTDQPEQVQSDSGKILILPDNGTARPPGWTAT